jgi:hypothetical protein
MVYTSKSVSNQATVTVTVKRQGRQNGGLSGSRATDDRPAWQTAAIIQNGLQRRRRFKPQTQFQLDAHSLEISSGFFGEFRKMLTKFR